MVSWVFFQSRWGVGLAVFRGEEWRVGGVGLERVVRSVGLGARRVILRLVRVERGREGKGKGGVRRPGLGFMMNF